MSKNYIVENEEERIRKILQSRLDHFSHICLKIIKKNPQFNEHPISRFKFNKAQWYIHKKIEEQRALKGYVRAIILKGRQQGCSTYVAARYFWQVINRFACNVFILTHLSDSSKALFGMVKRFYDNCPKCFCPEATESNFQTLKFGDLDSGYKVGTAGNETIGRGLTIQLFHGSEVAHWKHAYEHASGILESVPMQGQGTEIILESTANGVSDNYFYDTWKKAETGINTDFIPIFVPWFWQDEYRVPVENNFKCTQEEEEIKKIYGLDNDQINFRRRKISDFDSKGFNGARKFCQEYPLNANEAFQASDTNSFIDSNTVMLARKCKTLALGHVIIGIDPARGEDRTSIAIRQGRVCHEIISRQTKDLMIVVSMAIEVIEKWKPIKVFIDVIGIGAGVVDRLLEMGYDMVEGVNAAKTEGIDKNKYFNKRAEMWGKMNEWLLDEPCQIPDIDSLHSDLCCIGVHDHTVNGVLRMEKKSLIRSKHGSPDEADALALTFSKPLFQNDAARDIIMKDFSSSLAHKSLKLDQLRKNRINPY